MIIVKHTKQPIEVKDYVIDFSQWLTATGDVLDNCEVTILCTSRTDDPMETTLAVKQVLLNTLLGHVSVWLEKGTDGEKYKVTATVATTGGRVDQSEFTIKVKEV